MVRRFVSRSRRGCVFAALALASASAPLDASGNPDGTWHPWTATPQAGQEAFCDGARGRLLVFGGWDGRAYRADVRVMALEGAAHWSPLVISGPGPAPRSDATMIHDAARDRLIVFGGSNAASAFNDVWELSLGAVPAWTELAPWNPLTGWWSGHSAIHDPIRDRMIVYSGLGEGSGLWALPLGNPDGWIELLPPGPRPPPRYGHSAVYDPVADRMLVFGGLNLATGEPERSVWALSLAPFPAWSQLLSDGELPPARHAHTAVYDSEAHRMLVFGGVSAASERLDDAWSLSLWSPPTWSRLDAGPPAPGGRSAHGAVHDATRHRMIVVGGFDGTTLFDDAWALDLVPAPSWRWLTADTPVPPLRTGHTAVFDARRDRMIVFGGSVLPGADALHVLSLVGTRAWQPLPVTGEPAAPRSLHTAILDPVGDRMIVYGMASEAPGFESPLVELRLSDSTSWHPIEAAGPAPLERYGHVAVYDAPRHRMIVFGGLGRDGHVQSDVWSLSLADPPAWAPLAPAGVAPTARRFAAAAYDPARERMIVFGGANYLSNNQTWALSLSGTPEWTLLSPQGPLPAPRSQASLVYDQARDRLVLFGGSAGANRLGDAWELPLGAPPVWSPLATEGAAPRPRSSHTAIADPLSDRMIVFGGYSENAILGDLWSLDWREVVAVDPPAAIPAPATVELSAPWPNPSSGGVRLSFGLPRASRVSLVVHDLAGRRVRVLADATLEAGRHAVSWDRRDDSGNVVGSGIYFVRLTTPGARRTGKVALIR